MIIVIEGVDNTGKSTLAAHLAATLKLPVVSSEGREKYPGEINMRVERYLGNYPDNVIFDRHPVISQSIYNAVVPNTPVRPELIEQFYDRRPVIIYARRSTPTMVGHVTKVYDDPQYVKQIDETLPLLQILYDNWALVHATHIWHFGTAYPTIPSTVPKQDFLEDIKAFHEKFQLSYKAGPRLLSPELKDFRAKFMREELDEYLLSYLSNEVTAMELSLDALVDLVYVALGTAYLHGYDFREAWRRVHLANMRKQRVLNPADSKRGSTYDVIKPPGWQAPYMRDLVLREPDPQP